MSGGSRAILKLAKNVIQYRWDILIYFCFGDKFFTTIIAYFFHASVIFVFGGFPIKNSKNREIL